MNRAGLTFLRACALGAIPLVAGCAGRAGPGAPGHAVTLPAPTAIAYRAAVNGLLDAGYIIDRADSAAGILHAYRYTDGPSGAGAGEVQLTIRESAAGAASVAIALSRHGRAGEDPKRAAELLDLIERRGHEAARLTGQPAPAGGGR